MWSTSRPAQTAEWLCTKCGTTNRKLLAPSLSEARDRCVQCKTPHALGRGTTPVRWNAKAA